MITGTDYLTLRSIPAYDWPEDAQDAADLILSSPVRMLTLETMVERDGSLMAREWLARNVQIALNFHESML